MLLKLLNPLLQNIIESFSCGIVIHNARGDIIYANRLAADMLHLTHSQLVGRDSFDPRWCALNSEGLPLKPDAHPAMRALNERRFVGSSIMGIRSPAGQTTWITVSANYINPHPEPNLDEPAVIAFFHGTAQRMHTAGALKLFQDLAATPSYNYLKERFRRVIVALKDLNAGLLARDQQKFELARNLVENAAFEMDRWRVAYERLAMMSDYYLSDVHFDWDVMIEKLHCNTIVIDEKLATIQNTRFISLGVYYLVNIIEALCGDPKFITIRQENQTESILIEMSCKTSFLLDAVKGDCNLILSGDEDSQVEHRCFREVFNLISEIMGGIIRFNLDSPTISIHILRD